MDEILDYLKSNKQFIVDKVDYENEKIVHIYFRDAQIFYLVIAPHEGTHLKFLLKANAQETFDKWGNCTQEYLRTTGNLIVDILKNHLV